MGIGKVTVIGMMVGVWRRRRVGVICVVSSVVATAVIRPFPGPPSVGGVQAAKKSKESRTGKPEGL